MPARFGSLIIEDGGALPADELQRGLEQGRYRVLNDGRIMEGKNPVGSVRDANTGATSSGGAPVINQDNTPLGARPGDEPPTGLPAGYHLERPAGEGPFQRAPIPGSNPVQYAWFDMDEWVQANPGHTPQDLLRLNVADVDANGRLTGDTEVTRVSGGPAFTPSNQSSAGGDLLNLINMGLAPEQALQLQQFLDGGVGEGDAPALNIPLNFDASDLPDTHDVRANLTGVGNLPQFHNLQANLTGVDNLPSVHNLLANLVGQGSLARTHDLTANLTGLDDLASVHNLRANLVGQGDLARTHDLQANLTGVDQLASQHNLIANLIGQGNLPQFHNLTANLTGTEDLQQFHELTPFLDQQALGAINRNFELNPVLNQQQLDQIGRGFELNPFISPEALAGLEIDPNQILPGQNDLLFALGDLLSGLEGLPQAGAFLPGEEDFQTTLDGLIAGLDMPSLGNLDLSSQQSQILGLGDFYRAITGNLGSLDLSGQLGDIAGLETAFNDLDFGPLDLSGQHAAIQGLQDRFGQTGFSPNDIFRIGDQFSRIGGSLDNLAERFQAVGLDPNLATEIAGLSEAIGGFNPQIAGLNSDITGLETGLFGDDLGGAGAFGRLQDFISGETGRLGQSIAGIEELLASQPEDLAGILGLSPDELLNFLGANDTFNPNANPLGQLDDVNLGNIDFGSDVLGLAGEDTFLDFEGLNLPQIDDFTEPLNFNLLDQVLDPNFLNPANPFDTRRDEILNPVRSRLRHEMEETADLIAHRAGVLGNEGSSNTIGQLRRLGEEHDRQLGDIESRFGLEAARLDEPLRLGRLSALSSALSNEQGRVHGEIALQSGLERDAFQDFLNIIQTGQQNQLAAQGAQDQGLSLGAGALGSTIQAGDFANASANSAANVGANAANAIGRTQNSFVQLGQGLGNLANSFRPNPETSSALTRGINNNANSFATGGARFGGATPRNRQNEFFL